MSEPLRGVVVAHTRLAEALLASVHAIAGEDAGLVAVSNTGCDREALIRALEAAVGTGGPPALVFTDLAGGSCAHTAAALARGRADVRVVTGVNLAMLVDFAFHRSLSVDEAAARAVEIGRAAVGTIGTGAGAAGAGAGGAGGR